jgi:hypothetical protein
VPSRKWGKFSNFEFNTIIGKYEVQCYETSINKGSKIERWRKIFYKHNECTESKNIERATDNHTPNIKDVPFDVERG